VFRYQSSNADADARDRSDPWRDTDAATITDTDSYAIDGDAAAWNFA